MNSSEDKPDLKAAILTRYFSGFIALFSIGVLIYLIACSAAAFGTISDLPEYYAPAKLCMSGQGAASYVIDLLGQEQHRLFPAMGKRIVLLFVPPPGLMLITPLSLLSPFAAVICWKIFLILCLISAILILVRTFSLNQKETCYLIAAICFSQACYEALRIDQLVPILLLAITAAIYYLQRNQDIKAGLFLSLFIFKPQLILVFLAYLAGMRRWRPLVVFLCVLSSLTIVAYFVIGGAGFKNYFDLVGLPISVLYMQPELMPTLRGQLLKLWPVAASNIMIIAIIIYAIIIGLSYILGAKNRHAYGAILWGILVLMPVGLITSLHCHSYDLLLLVPSIIAVFKDSVMDFKPYFKSLIILGGIVFMIPLSLTIHYDYLLRGGQFNIWFLELLVLSLAIIQRALLQRPALNAVVVE